jgi:hypothetical protein
MRIFMKLCDQVHPFSCSSVLHNAVIAWNMIQFGEIVSHWRAEGMTSMTEH